MSTTKNIRELLALETTADDDIMFIVDSEETDNTKKNKKVEVGNISALNFGSNSGEVATWAEGDNTDLVPTSKVADRTGSSTNNRIGPFGDWDQASYWDVGGKVLNNRYVSEETTAVSGTKFNTSGDPSVITVTWHDLSSDYNITYTTSLSETLDSAMGKVVEKINQAEFPRELEASWDSSSKKMTTKVYAEGSSSIVVVVNEIDFEHGDGDGDYSNAYGGLGDTSTNQTLIENKMTVYKEEDKNVVDFYSNPSALTNSHELLGFESYAKNSDNEKTKMSDISFEMANAAASIEETQFKIEVVVGGTVTEVFRIATGGAYAFDYDLIPSSSTGLAKGQVYRDSNRQLYVHDGS